MSSYLLKFPDYWTTTSDQDSQDEPQQFLLHQSSSQTTDFRQQETSVVETRVRIQSRSSWSFSQSWRYSSSRQIISLRHWTRDHLWISQPHRASQQPSMNNDEIFSDLTNNLQVSPPPSYHDIPGTVPVHQGVSRGPPPSYEEAVDPNGKILISKWDILIL